MKPNKKEPGVKSHTDLTARLFGSIVITDSVLHFLQYPGKFTSFVSSRIINILPLHFGHGYQKYLIVILCPLLLL